jgi:hypothetical protein
MATERDEHCFLCLGPLDPKGTGDDEPFQCNRCPAAVHNRCVVSRGRKSYVTATIYLRTCACQNFEYKVYDIEEHVRWQWKPRSARQYWRFILTLLVCTCLHPLLIMNWFPVYALAFTAVFFLALAMTFDPSEEDHRPPVFTCYATVSALFGVLANSEIIGQLFHQSDVYPFARLSVLGSFKIVMISIAKGVLDFVAALNEWAFAVTSLYFPSLVERASFDYWFGRAGTLVSSLLCILFALETLWNCLFELKMRHVKRKMQ